MQSAQRTARIAGLCPLAFLGGVLILFGVLDNPSAGSFLITIPEIGWEAFLCIYLTFKGFRPSAVAALGSDDRFEGRPAPSPA